MAADRVVADEAIEPGSHPLITWVAAIAVCLYFAWSGIWLYKHVDICARAFRKHGSGNA